MSRARTGVGREGIPELSKAVCAVLACMMLPVVSRADVPVMPTPRVVPNYVWITNLKDFPQYVVIAAGKWGNYQVVNPGDSVDLSFYSGGLTFYAAKLSDFHEEEMGYGRTASRDYIENTRQLLRFGVPLRGLDADRAIKIEQYLKIDALTRSRFTLRLIGERVIRDDGSVREGPEPKKALENSERRWAYNDYCIRILSSPEQERYALIMRYDDGYKMVTAGQDIISGWLYACDTGAFRHDEIPAPGPEELNYFAEQTKLKRVAIRRSIGQFSTRLRWPSRVADVFQLVISPDSSPSLEPVEAIYASQGHKDEVVPASKLTYENTPQSTHPYRDYAVEPGPSRQPAHYVYFENLDSFPDATFLYDWPRTGRVLESVDTVPLADIFVVSGRLSGFDTLKTISQRRRELLRAQRFGFSPWRRLDLPPGNLTGSRIVHVARAALADSGLIRFYQVREICRYADGHTLVRDDSLGLAYEIFSSNPMAGRDFHDRAGNGRARVTNLLWYVIVPIVALIGIGVLLASRMKWRGAQ